MRIASRYVCDDLGDISYKYDLYEFGNDELVLIARSYIDQPTEAHFLRKEVDGQALSLTAADTRTEVFLAAVAYLRNLGKKDVRYLSVEGGGYVQVPEPAAV